MRSLVERCGIAVGGADRLERARRNVLGTFLVLTVASVFPQRALADNWTRFRGANGSGISEERGLPTSWTHDDYAWNITIPGVGHSSPIIWKDRLFLSSAEEGGTLRYLFCLDAATGEQIWARSTGMNESNKHNKSSWASSTPVTDGERVYVTFADKESYLLAAYDFDGTLLWRRDLGPYESRHGLGASPILFGQMIIVPKDQQGPSSIVALDCRNGQTLWSVLRAYRETAYTTPLIYREADQRPQLICSSGVMGVTSLDPYTGRMNWAAGPSSHRMVASPVLADGSIVQTSGGGGIGKHMVVLDPAGKLHAARNGEKPPSRVKYERERILPYVPTPISYARHLYLWNDNGVVSCVETETGANVWTERIEGGGKFSGSPICVAGNLYVMSEAGDVVVLAASPTYKFLARIPLNDPSHSTPAMANGRLYLRTYHRLACLEANP